MSPPPSSPSTLPFPSPAATTSTPTTLLDISTIRSLSDVGSMTRHLHTLISHQRSLDLTLSSLLNHRTTLDTHLATLQKSSLVLEIIKGDADHVLGNIRSTCDLADQVSGKVRELDLAQSRVKSTLSRLDAIVERGKCVEGVRDAMGQEDWEMAAEFWRKLIEIEKRCGGGDDGLDGRGGSVEELAASRKQLENIIRRKLQIAVDQREHNTILRFVRLFPLLGLEEEGLQIYVAYLKKVVSSRAKEEIDAVVSALSGVSGSPVSVNFVDLLTDLFKDLVLAVEENKEILRSLCGEDGIVYAIIELHEECESKGSLILKKYMEYRRLSRLTSEINSYSKNLLSIGSAEGPDPRKIELYLEEILQLTQLGEDYTEFMVGKIRSLSSVDQELGPRATKTFKSGGFSRVVQDITGFYVILEEFFMVENVRKATKIDEYVEDSLTTSMVDDVFYVLKSCCKRAISTSNINSVLAVLSGAVNLLSNEYQDALQQKIREPNLGAKLFSGGVGVEKTGTEIATALNNMDVSSDYVLKLRDEIERQCVEVFPAPVDREKIKSCLSELGEMSSSFKKVLNAGMEQLVSTITPRIRPVLDTVATISYELSEAEYAENELNDPWVRKLLHAVETNASWLQPVMTSENYDLLVHMIIDFIVRRLEVIMMQKRFSQLGGLQLDRDARMLVSHFSSMSNKTVRDKFARLTQMATILNLEKVSEILDFWGENSGPMTWRLTPAEVRRVLGLRTDFKPESIAALKL